MKIELYHYKLTFKNKCTGVVKSMIGAIRATSRNHSLRRLEDKMPMLTTGMFEVISFESKTIHKIADDLIEKHL